MNDKGSKKMKIICETQMEVLEIRNLMNQIKTKRKYTRRNNHAEERLSGVKDHVEEIFYLNSNKGQ